LVDLLQIDMLGSVVEEEDVRVALLQMELLQGRDEIDLSRICILLEKAVSSGCHWALLPDLSEFFALRGAMHAQATRTERGLESLCKWAREFHVGILGSLPQSMPEGIFSTAFCIDPQGKVQGVYRGEPPSVPGGDRPLVGSASPLPLFEWEDTMFGVLLSREVLLPERVRGMTLSGVDMVCVSALWSRRTGDFWQGVLRTRAAENRIHVLAVNAWSPDEDGPGGKSVAVGPEGNVLVSLEEGESVRVVDIEAPRFRGREIGSALPEIRWWPTWRRKHMSLGESLPLLERLRRRGRVVVFTNGCFDILHAGHVEYLEAARSLGDLLVVGINTDESVCRIKGPGRPILCLEDRIRALSGLQCVDLILPFGEDTPLGLIEAVRPQVLVKGADWPEGAIVGADLVRSWGGRVVRIPLREGLSTSGIIQRISGRISPKTN
jgi:rfaE bifunctional protein nucleotidyltransferase chain/domain